jgi:AcrR family transcriptional regulator
MPRQPDPDLEERIIKAADTLWRRGGARALTMRSVARAAGTNTPAVYRRFKDREDLIKALVLRIAARLREQFRDGESMERMADAYVEYALKTPNEYELFYTHAFLMSPRKGRGKPRPIRETRQSFALAEELMAKNFGGTLDDYTESALTIWALLHGTSMLLLSKSIPEGHEEAMREACRAGIRIVLASAARNASE